MKNKLWVMAAGSAVLGSLLFSGIALAQTQPAGGSQEGWGGRMGHMMGRAPGVFGTVSAINGSTLTITSKGFGPNAAAQTYTVDASSATVMKNNATSTLSAVVVGDTVMVQGTVSGTSVTAKTIRDGMPAMRGDKEGTPMRPSFIQGNGQPVVGGSVTAVNGSSLTITNKGNATFTIDATHATVAKDNASSTLSAIAVGDMVIVQGTINGSAVTASSIIDQGAAPATQADDIGTPQPHKGFIGGMMGSIGGFFKHLFGF
jgi:hypothetical protein